MARSEQESPVLEIGTPGLTRRGLETGPRRTYTGTKLETADTAKGSLPDTAPVLDPTERAGAGDGRFVYRASPRPYQPGRDAPLGSDAEEVDGLADVLQALAGDRVESIAIAQPPHSLRAGEDLAGVGDPGEPGREVGDRAAGREGPAVPRRPSNRVEPTRAVPELSPIRIAMGYSRFSRLSASVTPRRARAVSTALTAWPGGSVS